MSKKLALTTAGIISAMIIGSGSPQSLKTADARQVDEQTNSTPGPKSDSPVPPVKNEARQAPEPVSVYPTYGYDDYKPARIRSSKYSKWCNQPGSGGFNRVKHGRKIRRKNRR